MQLQPLTPHVHWLPPNYSTDRPVLGVIHGRRGSLIVDAGNSPKHAELLRGEITRLNLPAPQYVAITHWHWDHVFGIGTLNLPTLAHIETQRIVTEMTHLEWNDEALDQRVAFGQEIAFCRDMIKAELPDRTGLQLVAPDIGFVERMVVDLGDIMCHLIHVGGDHAPDSVIVYVPQARVLFLGDCLNCDVYHQPYRYTVARAIPLVEKLLQFEADYYLWGHGDEPMGRAAFLDFVAVIKQLAPLLAQYGSQREIILAHLTAALGRELTEDDVELVDDFLAGLEKE